MTTSPTTTALHEAAHFTGAVLYLQAQALELITHLSIEESRRGNRGHDGAQIITTEPELTLGKIMLCSMAADYLTSGEEDTFTWLENRLEGYTFFSEMGTEAIHPVFDQVVTDLRKVWPSVRHIAAELEERRYIPGGDLRALAQRSGLIPAPEQSDAPRGANWLEKAFSFITQKLIS